MEGPFGSGGGNGAGSHDRGESRRRLSPDAGFRLASRPRRAAKPSRTPSAPESIIHSEKRANSACGALPGIMRYLIVNADDFGFSEGVNRGILEAHDKGIVTSASLMVERPAAVEAADRARERPRL